MCDFRVRRSTLARCRRPHRAPRLPSVALLTTIRSQLVGDSVGLRVRSNRGRISVNFRLEFDQNFAAIAAAITVAIEPDSDRNRRCDFDRFWLDFDRKSAVIRRL